MLKEGDLHRDERWQDTLADDYLHPRYHVSSAVAMGRRIRRNYLWILLIQAAAYIGKLIVHPDPVSSFNEFLSRADIGPVPGIVILTLGVVYCITWAGMAFWSGQGDRRLAATRPTRTSMG